MRLIIHIILVLAVLTTTAFAQRSGRSSRSSSSSSSRTSSGSGVVHVRGYTRKDGTYVPPHDRTAPNGTKLDNWSTKGNINPETGKPGTIDPYPENTRSNTTLSSSTVTASDRDSLSNQDVIDMVHAGLTTEDIKRIIQEAQTSFDISVSALVELKRAGISDEVVTAMMDSAPQRNATSEGLPPVKNDAVGNAAELNLTSPEVRGFRLGMPMGKVLARFERMFILAITVSG